MDEKTIILLLIPILLIQIILIVVNLLNLKKKKGTKYFSKTVWLILLIVGSYISNIIYILIEGEKFDDSDQD